MVASTCRAPILRQADAITCCCSCKRRFRLRKSARPRPSELKQAPRSRVSTDYEELRAKCREQRAKCQTLRPLPFALSNLWIFLDSINMRLVFMGTPESAVSTLRRCLQDGHDVVAVWTQPDRPAGRGNKVSASPVKEFALSRGLTVQQPSKIKT